jgi:hypothetical protein
MTRGPAPGWSPEGRIGFKLRLSYQKDAKILAPRLPEVAPTQFALPWKLHDQETVSRTNSAVTWRWVLRR